MTAPVSRETPPTPDLASEVFAERLEVAEQYAAWLADAGAARGLIGPREVPRLWERHLLNCAVITDLVPADASVCDIGSGAGLPGLLMAIRRPDLHLTLVEPLLRRTTFLDEVVADLELDNVTVVRGRAESLHGRAAFDVVTSRAVAGLEKLLAWSLPLALPGGEVLAMKGSSAAEEVVSAQGALDARGIGGRIEVLTLGENALSVPTTVVRVVAPAAEHVRLSPSRRPGAPRSGARSGSRPGSGSGPRPGKSRRR